MAKEATQLEVLPEPESALPDFSAMIQKSEERKINRKDQLARPETSLQLLKRLFGSVIFDLFPVDLMTAVDDAYKFWVANPNSYLATPFDSMESLRDAEALMRAYAEVADPSGYTIRTVGSDDPLTLTWRAQTRRTVTRKGEDEE